MNFPECSLICPEGAYQILIDTVMPVTPSPSRVSWRAPNRL